MSLTKEKDVLESLNRTGAWLWEKRRQGGGSSFSVLWRGRESRVESRVARRLIDKGLVVPHSVKSGWVLAEVAGDGAESPEGADVQDGTHCGHADHEDIRQRFGEETCPDRGDICVMDVEGKRITDGVGGHIGGAKRRNPCGCHVDGMGILPDPYRVHRCALHEAGSELKGALDPGLVESVARELGNAKWDTDHGRSAVIPMARVRDMVGALEEYVFHVRDAIEEGGGL